MGKHDWSWHQFRSLVARVAKHDALVSSTLFAALLTLSFLGINALRYVGRLGGEDVLDENLVGVEDIVIVHITNLTNRISGDLHIVEFRLCGDLTADNGDIAFHIGLAGHAAEFVLSKASVENGVGNSVCYLVGMAFADGFGGKDIAA